jgi:outer membrane murein-binding lipoprotein Lpp
MWYYYDSECVEDEIQEQEGIRQEVVELTSKVEQLQKELQEAREKEAARKKNKCNVVCK